MLLGEIDLFIGIGEWRFFGTRFSRTMAPLSLSLDGLHAHSASGRGVQVAAKRNSHRGSPGPGSLGREAPPRSARSRGFASPSRGPVRPNRAHRTTQRVLVSIRRIACLGSWHRAPLFAEEALGAYEGRGCRRAPLPSAHRKGCGSSLSNTKAKTSAWVGCHGALLAGEIPLQKVGVSTRLGAGDRSSSSVPRANGDRSRRTR